MAVEKQDFKLWQGEHKRIIITVTDGGGNPADLTGSSVSWVMQRQAYNETEPRIEKSTDDGIVITDPTGGILQISLIPDDTKTIPKGFYLHEAAVTDHEGHVSVITVGTVELAASII